MGLYFEKVNTSPKQKKIKVALEAIGHTNVEVWWEPIGGAPEMCGPEGGFFFHSDQESLEPLGYSFNEAMEAIETWEYLNVTEMEAGE
jgi:hypothetical protein